MNVTEYLARAIEHDKWESSPGFRSTREVAHGCDVSLATARRQLWDAPDVAVYDGVGMGVPLLWRYEPKQKRRRM